MQVSRKLILQDSTADNLIEEKESENPESQVIIYGFLQKQSKYMHLWKTRFFILSKNYLFAFTGIENDADCTMALLLSNVIEVREMIEKKSKKKIIILKCKKMDYLFRADNDLIYNKWMDNIKEAVKNITKNELKPIL